jgi:hypothetical protein
MPSGSAAPLNAAAARALLATLEIVGLSAAGHVAAGGSLPPPGYLLALGAAVFVASLSVLARWLRVWVILPLVGAAQVGLHLGFAHTAVTDPHLAAQAAAEPGSALMVSAHLVVTVVTALVLLLQSQAASRLAGWLERLLLTPAPTSSAVPGALLARLVRRCRRRLLLAASPRRGPPRGCWIAS